MAKKQIKKYVFHPGVSVTDNLNPNAYALITQNRQFILDTLVAYINYNVTNNIAPYVGYTFDPTKCIRDDGFIIDAYAHDIRYGGNISTRNVSSYFWIDGRPQITGSQQPELTGQNFVKDLINNYILTNQTAPTYGQTSSIQVKLSNNGESGVASRITSLVEILTDTIAQGLVAIPEKEYGVGTVRFIGKYEPSEVLLVTNVNDGQVIFNFVDPEAGAEFSYKSGYSSGGGYLYDLDFPRWSQTENAITTMYLEYDTSSMSDTDSIQIFTEEPYQTVRPWEFGTDAIERMRVAAPQAMLDADFEYGLQPTKWQALALQRSYPSIYEIPGTDITATSITTDASVASAGFGSSLITVTTPGNHGFIVGTPITIKGLDNAISGFSRAEGSFLVNSVPTSQSFTYYSQAKVGTSSGQELVTSFTQIRQGGFYTGASIGAPTFSVESNGTEATVTTLFTTPTASTRISFTGTPPQVGAPVSGSGSIVPGTSITGVAGSGSSVEVNLKDDISSGATTIEVTDGTGLAEGLALDNGSGSTIFVSSFSGTTLQLSAAYTGSLSGANGSNTNVSGTNYTGFGEGATFNVSRSAGTYTVEGSDDSAVNGQNYQVDDKLVIAGTALGGASPANDVLIRVTQIDSGGAILTFNSEGTAVSGGDTYENISQTSSTGSGINFRINVERVGGTGVYENIELVSGGTGHQPGDLVTFPGNLLGGSSPENDLVIRVNGVAFGTDAVVDFQIESGAGVTGDASYVGEAGTNFTSVGTSATFNVTRLDGAYTVTIASPGSGYGQYDKILINGSDLSGVDVNNDAIVIATGVDPETGAITSASISGSPFVGDSITLYSAFAISDPLNGSIPAETPLDVGAIATIEVSFDSAHGLLPGAAILTEITSTPAPAFESSETTLPSSGTWTGVASGIFNSNSYIAAVRTSSTAGAWSTDGTNWNASTLPANTTWSSIAFGYDDSDNPVFVTVGGGTNSARSTDGGQTWNAVALPTSGTWTGVAYYDGNFVAVRSGSNAGARSTDGGQTWSAVTLPANTTWTSVAGGLIGGLTYFVAVASGGTAAAYSINGGASWTAATLPSSGTWSSVAFGRDRFVTIASGGSAAAYSTNGQTWTASTLPQSANWNAIVYGDEYFTAVASGSTVTITTTDGQAWNIHALNSGANWDAITYGTTADGQTDFYVTTGNNTSAEYITITSPNHQLAAGPFFVTQVPDLTTIRYAARTQGIIDELSTMAGVLYSRPEAFFTHRAFDGGVQLGTGGPQHGATAIRQSKKYIRYQSGKGVMYTTGALFAPNYNLASATADGTAIGSLITFTTDDTDHGLQPGGVVEIVGMDTTTYNGVYTVESIVNERSFKVRTTTTLTGTTGVLGVEPKMLVKTWHGAVVRTGPFDDQNGLFFQYDGQRMAVVKRSSTLQIAGTVAIATDSNAVFGTGTRFQDQLTVGDQIVIRGMSHTVTSIEDQQNITIAPDFRGANDVPNAKIALTQDLVIPQEEWNLDPLDGAGPSGFDLDPTKMQMIGVQYSWYAAGFIEFMLRGQDGKFIFFHRIKNSNNNTEAYMRTANLPVRYEVKNEGARARLRTAMIAGSNSIDLFDAYYFPQSGTVYIDNELITYTGKTGNSLTGLTRGASLNNFAAGANRTYSAGSGTNHAVNAGVILVSNTITPVISHWGSALLTDGMFDEDRGYLFSYAANGVSVSTTRQTALLMRLAPSVSNAIIGDLGERELINRAQLLLQGLELTSDTGTGGIIVEGVLNPQNYPINPSDISWGGLSGLAQGGQPSFVQIAPGGSVNWNGGASLTTASATVSTDIDTGFVYDGFQNGERSSPVPLTLASYNAAGPVITGSQIYSQSPSAYTGTGGLTFTVTNVIVRANRVDIFYQDQFGRGTSTSTQNTGTDYKFIFPTYEGLTNRLLFTQASWEASGASVGTSVASSDTNWPAGTAIAGVVQRQLGGTTFYEVTFNQTSVQAISASDTVTFEFGNPPYAQPGETVFSFIAVPGERSTLDLTQLKELTNTTIGGRGTFPNGPDVLAINIYKVSGTAVNSNIIIRWSEAQA